MTSRVHNNLSRAKSSPMDKEVSWRWVLNPFYFLGGKKKS